MSADDGRVTKTSGAADDDRCPCLSGETYGGCCGRFHRGDADAPTAEALMRSRYTAFALGNLPYLLHSWHPDTRPGTLELDAAMQWRRLDIVRTVRGGPLDVEGIVEFRAFYRQEGAAGVLQESSRFVRQDGRWVYLDAEQVDLGF
ncbi:MAG: YchJ family protein [Actinomycetota bacterium]|nr:YchJ family protein [Actinomycetota bacterium]